MAIALSCILLSYLILIIILWLGWEKSTPILPDEAFTPNVSIVIALRNEAANITNLLNDLTNLDYPKEKLEIILVNDHSEDKTAELIKEFIKSSDLPIKLLELGEDHGKKAAMRLGFQEVTGDIILTTDGDCRLPKLWLRTMIHSFQNEQVKFVSGPVALSPQHGFFQRLQGIEFSSLVASGAATINLGLPTMANAANMAIRVSEITKRKIPAGSERASGDDVFLMHDLANTSVWAISFCKNQEAIVNTAPSTNLKTFFNQRKRWAGKWSSYKSVPSILLAIYIYLVNISTLTLPILVGLNYLDGLLAVNLLFIKVAFEYLFLRHVQKFFNSRILLHEFIILALIYPVYVTLTGFIATFTSYTWKDRQSR